MAPDTQLSAVHDASYKILLVTPDATTVQWLASMLSSIHPGHTLEHMSDLSVGLASIDAASCDVCIVDSHVGPETGLDVLRQAKSGVGMRPVLILADQDDREFDLAAMNAGAAGFLVKSTLDATTLERAIRYARYRAHTLEQSRANAERLERALDGTGTGIWDWDLGEGRIYISEQWARLMGYTGTELSGRIWRWARRVHRDDVRQVLRSLRLHLRGHSYHYDAEYRIRTRRGEWIWVHSRGRVASRDHAGNPTRMVGTHTNITERKKAEYALRQSEERFRELAELLPEIVFELDLVGRFTFVNQQAFVMTGYTLRDLNSNLSVADLFIESDRARMLKTMRARLEGSDHGAIEYTLVRRDGTMLPVRVHTTRIIRDGEVVGLRGIALDISEHKKTEAELQRRADALRAANIELEAQKEQMQAQQSELATMNRSLEATRDAAEAANRAKSEFLANMSHEIRTPMTAILGYAEVLRSDALSNGATPDVLDAIETIYRNGEHLLDILNGILDLSKIEAECIDIERVPVSPAAMLRDVESLMLIRAREKSLKLQTNWESAPPNAIETDPTRLRQILLNLVGNAIKFTANGEVCVHAQWIDRSDTDAGRLQIDVRDTGIGLTKTQRERLFQPFSQADASTTRRFGGTGLGLALSQRLARMLGGDITVVTSCPGVGSTFRLVIGAKAVDDRTPDKPDSETPARVVSPTVDDKKAIAGRRILLAEDGYDNQRILTAILERAGATVSVVENGRLAVQAALAAETSGVPYDIILMDMQMPEMDGYEATRQLRSAGLRRPIIALTAHAMTHDRRLCLDAGCDDYASKPVNRHDLIQLIAQHVTGVRQQQS